MLSTTYSLGARHSGNDVVYGARCVFALARADFKLKYEGSVLGYLWSLVRPLSYFGLLWLVFGQFFKGIVAPVENFPLYLLLGVVFYTFFVEATLATVPSLVARADMLRKLSFPRIAIPTAATLTACMTFALNWVAVVVLILVTGASLGLDALLLIPLLAELIVFALGLGLGLATLYARFRDIGPIWELVAQLLIFATPVMYPLSILPSWAQKVELANPLVQVMQDARVVIVDSDRAETAAAVFASSGGRLIPVAVAVLTLALGLLLFARAAPRLPERI